MLIKSPENADGRTDGQTDGHYHGIIRPFFKRAYKKAQKTSKNPKRLTCNTTYCRKKPGKTSKNPKRAKMIAKIHKNNTFTKNGTYVEKYTAGHPCTKFKELIFIYEAMVANNGLDLLLAVNWVKVT